MEGLSAVSPLTPAVALGVMHWPASLSRRLSPVESACKCLVSGNTVVPPCLASQTYFQGHFRGETWRNQLLLTSVGGRFGLRSFCGFILARRRRFRAAVSGHRSIRFSIRASVNRDL
jgi:hypothetical protein